MLWHSRVLALVAAVAVLGGACGGGGGGGTSGGKKTGASITIATGSEPGTLDPQLKDDGGERAVNDNVYETLMARQADGTLVPGLASEGPTQVDDTTWQFKLRPSVKFTDGEAFNADAVVFSVKRIIDPSFKSEQASFFGTITGATKVDDLTVNVTTNGPDPVLPSRMYWMKMVAPQAAAAATFAEKPVGTGPYKFVEWVKGDHVTLEANPGYWGDKPSIAKVTYKFIPEAGTRLQALLSGQVDLITNILPEDLPQAPKSAHVPGLEHPIIILNARKGITADERVRQALNYAVDKQAIVKNIFGGLGVIDNCQLLSPAYFGYDSSLQPYPYDVNKAKELLTAAGATGKNIVLTGEAGRWLKDKETIQAVAQFWEAAGLKVQVQILDFATEYLKRLFQQPGRPDAIYVSSSNELLDADRGYSNYYADGGPGASNSDAELKDLITKARTETDENARRQEYAQASKLACDKAYHLYLLNNEDTYGMSKKLEWTPRVDAKLIVKEMSVSS